MIPKLLAVTLLLINGVTINAQKCMPGSQFWADFSGVLNGRTVELCIYRETDGNLVGNYRFSNDDKNVFFVTGSEKNCSYTLNEMSDGNNLKSSFTFQYVSDKATKKDAYTGTHTDAGGKKVPVKLALGSMVYGSAKSRYGELFGTTQEVDSFAAKIKNAFIQDDKNWLAAHCKYPLNIYKGTPQPTVIKNAADFLAKYNILFSKAYKEKFKKMKCYNMFCNHVGAIMGKGEVKINHTATSEKDKYEYCITGFEVFTP